MTRIYKSDIAKWLGISLPHYSNYTNQGVPFGLATLRHVSHTTGISIDDLIDGDRQEVVARIEKRYSDFINSLSAVKQLDKERRN